MWHCLAVVEPRIFGLKVPTTYCCVLSRIVPCEWQNGPQTPEPGLPHRDADGWVAAFAPEEEAPIWAGLL
jgi:hypothetical protein